MTSTLHTVNGHEIVELTGPGIISDAQQFLEVMMNLPSDRFIVRREQLCESFFDLKTGLAGEILQKVVNYQRRLGIVGDFSVYTSNSLRDFIYESNKSGTITFASSVDEAIIALSR